MESLHLPSYHHHHHQQQQQQQHLHADLALNREHPSFFLGLLRSCQKEKSLGNLSILHARLLATSSIVAEDAYIGSALITAYADCGSPSKALQAFNQISPRDVVLWNALISGYVRNGLGKEALAWFQHMRGEGIRPNAVTYISVSKACALVGSLRLGNVVAAEVRRHGFLHRNPALGTALMDMYFRCGAVGEARELFEHLPVQNVVSWTALIRGYVEHGLAEEALECFEQMREVGDVRPNVVTLRAVLKACGIARCRKVGEEIDAAIRGLEIGEEIGAEMRGLEIGEEIGAEMRGLEIGEEIGAEMRGLEIGEEIDTKIRSQREASDRAAAALGSALVSMYAKCGELRKAQAVFDELLPDPDAAAWNSLIIGYAQNGFDEEALGLLRRMRSAAGARPSTAAYLCLLRACGRAGSLEIGMQIDAEVREEGLLSEHDSPLGSALVDMYSKCGVLRRAEAVFKMLAAPDLAAWNALIAGFVRNGAGDSALECFERMRGAGLAPDPATYACVAKACGITGSLALGEGIRGEVEERGLLQTDPVLGTALLDMYAKCGAVKKATQVFEQLPVRNIVSWSAMISAYAQNGLGEEALHCFEQMQKEEGVRPNAVTYASVLKACSIVGSLAVGEQIYLTARRQHLWEDAVLGTALVDMYSKCGDVEKAKEVFDELPVRTVASWSALGSGYAQFGRADAVFALHGQMQQEEPMPPDSVSFLILLTACSHAGLVKQGETLFDRMRGIEDLVSEEHYVCMVDSYGRAGSFGQMMKALLDDHALPSSRRLLPFFLSVLGACRKWRNLELARWAFEQALRLDAECLSAYVCMQNVYASDEMQIEAEEE